MALSNEAVILPPAPPIRSSDEVDGESTTTEKKRDLIIYRPRRGEGKISEDEKMEMQRACGYGGPHTVPDISVIRRLCRKWGKQAVEARVRGAGMNTPVMTAIKYGHKDIAMELIEAKWDNDVTIGEKVLETIDKIRKREAGFKEKWDNRANVRALGIFRWSPLHWASREALPEVVKAIIEKIPLDDVKEYINAADKRGRTPLWLAIVNNVVDAECRDRCKWYERALEVIECLVDNGADISKALSCKFSEDDFLEHLFMEFQLEGDKHPEKYFFQRMRELAISSKQANAEEQLGWMLADYENSGGNKKDRNPQG